MVNKLFPKTKGGPGFTKNQAIILKNIHGELQELIKEFRRKLDIPLIKTKTSTFPEMIDSEEVHEYFPEINTLLDSEEIPILTSQASIAKTSLNIIAKRLRKSLNIHQQVTTASLKNIISRSPRP